MSNRAQWPDPVAGESPPHSSESDEDGEAGGFHKLTLPAEERRDTFLSPKSATRKSGARSSWRTDVTTVIAAEPESTPRGTRTHDVRTQLSELQAEFAKQGELLKKTSSALKTKEKLAKKLETDNQELERELKDLRTKVLDMKQPPESVSVLQARLDAKNKELAIVLEDLSRKSAEMDAFREEYEEQIEARDHMLTAMKNQFQSQIATKEQELAEVQEGARRTEQETKEKVEKEMERLCGILAQSSQKLTALQEHLRSANDGCVCKELLRQEDSSGKNLNETLASLRDDVLLVKFELEGLHKLFCEMKDGRGFQITALLNRTLVMKPKESFCLHQCIEGVADIKRILMHTKEVVAQIYTERDFQQ